MQSLTPMQPRDGCATNCKFEEILKEWDNFSIVGVRNKISLGTFIIELWGDIRNYANVALPNGWYLITTAREVGKNGTIMLAASNANTKRLLEACKRCYFVNYGLTLNQADTFNLTNMSSKYKVIHLLHTVLNDQALYKAYRSHRRNMKRDEYTAWLSKHNLLGNTFNLSLVGGMRDDLSTLLKMMVTTDNELYSMRRKIRDNLPPA